MSDNQYIPQTDLCAGWRLADLYDFSGNAKTLTNNGTVVFTAIDLPDGLNGKTAHFGSPNSSKYLTVTSTSQADIDINLSTNAVTIAGWARITALPSSGAYPTIVQWDAVETADLYCALWYKNDGGTYKLQADFAGNVASYSVTLTVDTWYWVVLTAAAGAGAATALYLNGVPIAASTKGTTASSGTSKVQIGKHIAQSQYWPGQIYDVAIYKKAFTAAQILAWYDEMVGTVSTAPYVAINSTDLTSYVLESDSVSPDGGEIAILDNTTPNRDFSAMFYGGRNGRSYKFSMSSSTRPTLETLLGIINNAEEFDEFRPFNRDRTAYIHSASAKFGTPFRCIDSSASAFKWHHEVNCTVNTIDPLLYAPRKILFYALNSVLPTESYTVTNTGTYKSGLDYLYLSGYFDATNYTEDVDLSIGAKTIRLIDKMLYQDTFEMDRYGRVEHKFYTDYDLTEAQLENSLDGAGTAAPGTAGYHLGYTPMTADLSFADSSPCSFRIQVDSEATTSTVTLADVNTLVSGPLIAAEMQNKIQALGGAYAAVTVMFTAEGKFKITSGTTGTTSKVRIYDSYNVDGSICAMYLGIGSEKYSWYGSYECNILGEDHDGTDDDAGVGLGAGTAGYHTSGEVPCTIITNAGYHVSGEGAAIKLVNTGTKLKVQNDSAASATEITLSLASCTSASATAAHLQTKIRAIGAAYDGVVVRYENGRYLIISETTGSSSKVRITDGATLNVANTLCLGTANGGINYDGQASALTNFKITVDGGAEQSITLDTAGLDTGAEIATNMQTKIQAKGGVYASVTVVYSNGRYVITSASTGATSTVRIAAGATADISARLKIGTVNGGTDTDGLPAGSIAKNACVIGPHGIVAFPMKGPLQVFGAPKLEFYVNSVTGTPHVFYVTDSVQGEKHFLTQELVEGYNTVWIPGVQGEKDIWIGIYCGAESVISLFDTTLTVRRDIPPAEMPTVPPGDDCTFSITSAGSAKFSEIQMYYRDAFWS